MAAPGRSVLFLRVAVLLALAAPTCVRPAQSQEAPPRITVRVRQVAGATLYLDVGSRHGVVTGDTLRVFEDSAGSSVGRLVVTAGTDTRSVLRFAGAPFPVTRGMNLILQLRRVPAEPAPEVPVPTPQPVRPEPQPAPPSVSRPATRSKAGTRRPPAHGSWSLDLSGMRSSTTVGGADPVSVSRTFATPTLGFDLMAPDAVGPLRFRTSMRFSYRYSNQDIVQPATSVRVYALALEGDLGRRLRLSLGRFYGPVGSYSGFWDGAMVRVGGNGFGVGAIGGFEPDRWDERPSTTFPKATLFVDGRSSGNGWRWSGNLSANGMWPKDGEPNHTFVGATERLSAGPLWLSHDLQVDRDPSSGKWRISRLRIQGSVDVAGGVELRAGVARQEPWLYGLIGSPFGLRSDRANAGLALRGRTGYLAVDGSISRDALGERSSGATGSFALNTLLGGMGLFGSVGRWSGPYGSTLSAGPSLSFGLPRGSLRVGYRMDRSDYLGRVLLTNAVEASMSLAAAAGFRMTGRLRLQFGGVLSGQSFDLGLAKVF